MGSATARRTAALVALLLAVLFVGVPRSGLQLSSESRSVVSPVTDAAAVVVADGAHGRAGVAVLAGFLGGFGWAVAWLWASAAPVALVSICSGGGERRWRARLVGAPPLGARRA